ITETSFPNELQDLANVSGHMTPATLEIELRKLKTDVPVYLYGGKPKHLDKIKRQVRALRDDRLQMFVPGRPHRVYGPRGPQSGSTVRTSAHCRLLALDCRLPFRPWNARG